MGVSIYLSIDRSIYLSIDLSIDLSIYRSIDLSIYLSTYIYLYLSIYLSISRTMVSPTGPALAPMLCSIAVHRPKPQPTSSASLPTKRETSSVTKFERLMPRSKPGGWRTSREKIWILWFSYEKQRVFQRKKKAFLRKDMDFPWKIMKQIGI